MKRGSLSDVRMRRAPPGPKTADKSMAFINGVFICVRGFAAPAQLKTCLQSWQPVNHTERQQKDSTGSSLQETLQAGEGGRAWGLLRCNSLLLLASDCVWSTVQGREAPSNLQLMKLFQAPAAGWHVHLGDWDTRRSQRNPTRHTSSAPVVSGSKQHIRNAIKQTVALIWPSYVWQVCCCCCCYF